MERIDTLVIGAGAIGLAIGYEISKTNPDLVVIDKEKSFGKHTSSRNSEVIHAGHYYDPGSLKARLCVEGNRLLYNYLRENSIPCKNTGKIIVATNTTEEIILKKYHDLGEQNGCLPFSFLSAGEVKAMEPVINCISGLYIPSTGILDTHQYMQSLAHQIEDNGAFTVYGMEVVGISRDSGYYYTSFSNGEIIQSNKVINSGGLWSDSIARMAGMEIDAVGIRQHWCKGEYYKTTKIRNINHLVYPVADPMGRFLGIHLTINLNGDVRFGPNAYYVNEVDYRFDDVYFTEFLESINRFIYIKSEDLLPDDTGIRPKLQGPGDGFKDFYIKEETDNGLPGLVNLVGMESPGLTASLAVARYVKALI